MEIIPFIAHILHISYLVFFLKKFGILSEVFETERWKKVKTSHRNWKFSADSNTETENQVERPQSRWRTEYMDKDWADGLSMRL